MKKIMLRRVAIIAALVIGGAAISTYALGTYIGPRTTIYNTSIVNGGAHLTNTTYTAKGSRVGPPIHRLSTGLAAPGTLDAKQWKEYR